MPAPDRYGTCPFDDKVLAHYAGTFEAVYVSLLWTVHWDSHLSFLCSSQENLDRVDVAGRLEGFLCIANTEVFWSVHEVKNVTGCGTVTALGGNAGITIKQVWSDEDLLEFEITGSNGTSMFCTMVYLAYGNLEKLIGDLDVFRNHLHGGLCNISFGRFGPEYASGAFEARLHFYQLGRLAVTVRAEPEWRESKKSEVASSATLYFMSEPVLLDNFTEALKRLRSGVSSEAALWAAA